MIVSYNVCDFCGEQIPIAEDDVKSGIFVRLGMNHVKELLNRRTTFSKEVAYEQTFCDKECFIEFLKTKFNKYGQLLEENKEDKDEPRSVQ